jgi:hypothetical protein
MQPKCFDQPLPNLARNPIQFNTIQFFHHVQTPPTPCHFQFSHHSNHDSSKNATKHTCLSPHLPPFPKNSRTPPPSGAPSPPPKHDSKPHLQHNPHIKHAQPVSRKSAHGTSSDRLDEALQQAWLRDEVWNEAFVSS